VLALLPYGMRDPSNDPLGAQQERNERLAGLLQAAAGGDGRAFESFYSATSRHAMAVVRRIVGEALAEDVLAECYFQAWRQAARFDAARGSALTWLLTMARSRALDRLRQESLRHGGLSGAPDFDADACEHAAALSPDQLLESVEARTRLHDALRELSANERWVLGLAYFRDCTQSEIAAITGMPLGTVKSHMTRAQHKLRETLRSGMAA
jgi:RNA polymerase sigma-70 factor, ECF subfamily